MKTIPCQQDAALAQKISDFAEVLRTQSHTLGNHGLTEDEFYASGVFRGAIERIRGQYAATMGPKRDFTKLVLNYLQDKGYIKEWEPAGGANRFDYLVVMASGKIVAIESKGGLDGNNTNIFERPPNAQEFVSWSLSTNTSGNPERNAWSGIHTRLGAEMIDKGKHVDGLIIWDMFCGTLGRPCPKLAEPDRVTIVGSHTLPPPCIYLFPTTIASPRNNPKPPPHTLQSVEFLAALHTAFKGRTEEVHSVIFETKYAGNELQRRTEIMKNGVSQKVSKWTPIRRA